MASGLWTSGHVNWLAIIFLAALTALSERFDWSLYGTSRVSIAFAPIIAAVVLFGLAGLAVVVPVAILTSYLGSGRPVRRTAYNFGVLMLAGAAAELVFVVSGSAGEAGAWPGVKTARNVAPSVVTTASCSITETGTPAGSS